MVFLELLQRALALDIGFFIDFVLGNLFWEFAFYSLIYFFYNGKRVLYFAIIFTIMMWAWVDLEHISGLYWTVGSFLLIYYITKIATVAIVESTPRLKRYVVIISSLQFYVLFLVYQFFIK